MNAAAAPLRPYLHPAHLSHEDVLVRDTPFAFLVAPGQLATQARAELDRDFPRYRSAGFFPHEAADCGAAVNRLIDELTAPAMAHAIGTRLGLPDLHQRPYLVTICRHLNRRHGTIHTDSRSKIATALLYLNERWEPEHAGCLRFLNRIDDINDLAAPEIRPLYGTLVAFRRADNSFHGHLPHEGERRVIQVAWLVSDEDRLRKARRGRLSRMFKKIAGSLDRRIGAQRAPDAARRD